MLLDNELATSANRAAAFGGAMVGVLAAPQPTRSMGTIKIIGSAPRAIGSADRKLTQSNRRFRASLLTSVFMTPTYEPRTSVGKLKVTRRTGVLRGGPRCCGLVRGDVWKMQSKPYRPICQKS